MITWAEQLVINKSLISPFLIPLFFLSYPLPSLFYSYKHIYVHIRIHNGSLSLAHTVNRLKEIMRATSYCSATFDGWFLKLKITVVLKTSTLKMFFSSSRKVVIIYFPECRWSYYGGTFSILEDRNNVVFTGGIDPLIG